MMKTIARWLIKNMIYHIKQKRFEDFKGDITLVTFIGFDSALKIRRNIPYFHCEGFTSEHIVQQREKMDLEQAEKVREDILKRVYPKLFK